MSGLQKQRLFVNFGQGIDTKTDPKLVVPGKLSELENGVFKKVGRIDKRPGYGLVSGKTLANEALTDGSALATFDSELLQYNKQKLYSYSKGAEKWIDKGSAVSASVMTRQMVKNTASQTQVDYASNQGISVFAYEDSRGGVRATVYDERAGTPMLADTSLDASASRVRCVSFGNYIYVFYYKSGSLYGRRLNPQQPTSFDTAVEITNDINTTTPTYDVVAYQSLRIAFVYHTQSDATESSFGWVDEDLAVLTGALAETTLAAEATDSLAIILGPSNTFYIAWANTTDGLQATILNNGGAEIVAPTTVDNYTSSTIVNITGFKARDESGVTLFYELTNASAHKQLVRKNTLTIAGSAGTPAVFLRSVGLYSRAFSYYFDSEDTDHGYVCVTHSSTLQSTYFVARDDGLIVAKMQAGLGGGLTTRPILASVSQPDSDSFSFAILNKFKLVSDAGTLFSLQGVSKTTVNFDADEQFNAAQLGGNLHIVGGVLSMYDGQSVVEHGFHLYPENLSASQSGAAGVADGDYNYIAFYEWTDNKGQIHRSAPSVPLAFTVSGGPRNVAVVVPTLRLTAKTPGNGRSNISVVLCRTEEGPGEIYYRVSSVSSPTFNDTTADSVTITDTTSDTALVSNEILYTTGGVLENMSPPSCRVIDVFKNRIFLAGLENENEYWYSKENQAGEAVEFAAELRNNVGSEGGGLSTLAVLDDKFLLFKNDRLFFTYGDGPNNTGTFGEFAAPQFITADAGCPYPNSVVRTPAGIMFKSLKGYYFLDSSLNMGYIGADVDAYNDKTVTSAVLKSDDNQVRFTHSDGPLLVYDYHARQWGTFTAYEAYDAVIWDNSFVMLSTNGKVFKEDPTIYRDNGAGIRLKLVTGWIALDSIIGLQRIYKASIIGEYKSYHKLRVSVGYDFSNTWTSVYEFDTDTNLGITTFGEASPFGNESVFGGDSNAYRFVMRLDRQKCQAIRFMIEDLTVSSTPGTGEGYNITGIGLEAGIKAGVGKFKNSLKIASV